MSSVEDTVLMEAVSLTDLETVRGLGPIGFEASGSTSWLLPSVNSSGSLGGLLNLELGLGNEPEVKGVMAWRFPGEDGGSGTPLSGSSKRGKRAPNCVLLLRALGGTAGSSS